MRLTNKLTLKYELQIINIINVENEYYFGMKNKTKETISEEKFARMTKTTAPISLGYYYFISFRFLAIRWVLVNR